MHHASALCVDPHRMAHKPLTKRGMGYAQSRNCMGLAQLTSCLLASHLERLYGTKGGQPKATACKWLVRNHLVLNSLAYEMKQHVSQKAETTGECSPENIGEGPGSEMKRCRGGLRCLTSSATALLGEGDAASVVGNAD